MSQRGRARQVSIWAHRGVRGSGRENSIEGIVAAASMGIGVEVDVRLIASGEAVLHHDHEHDGHEIATMSRDQAAELGIPTLKDALAAAPDVPFDLELKGPADPLALGEALVDAIGGRTDGLVISSFLVPLLDEVREMMPGIAFGVLSSVMYDADGRFALNCATERGFEYAFVEDAAISVALAEDATAAGCQLVAWTVNDVARMQRLIEWGCRGIITDEPDVAMQALAKIG